MIVATLASIMIFTEPIPGPPDRRQPIATARGPIEEWHVIYHVANDRTVARDMAVMKGFDPPVKAQWDGVMYTRQFINRERLTATYARYAEDQK